MGASDGDTKIYAIETTVGSAETGDPSVYMGGGSRSNSLVRTTSWTPVMRLVRSYSGSKISRYYQSSDPNYVFEFISAIVY